MLLTTTEAIEGKKIRQVIGLVMGNTVRAKNIGRDITSALRNIAGGEIKAYTDMMTEARQEALQRMMHEAEKVNADAIICLRFTTVETMAGAAEILAYGTAVKLK